MQEVFEDGPNVTAAQVPGFTPAGVVNDVTLRTTIWSAAVPELFAGHTLEDGDGVSQSFSSSRTCWLMIPFLFDFTFCRHSL